MKPDSIFQRRLPSLILALLTMALWGSLFPAVKLGYAAFRVDTAFLPDILLFAGMRFTACGGAYLLFDSLSRRRFSFPPAAAWPYVFWIGLFSVVLHYAFTYIGLSMNGGSKTAILKQLGSLFAVCFGFVFLRQEHFSWYKFAGGILGFTSILLIDLDQGSGFHYNIGEVLVILASFCTVAAGAVSKKAYASYPLLLLTAYAQLTGGLALLAAGLLLGGRVSSLGPQAAGVFLYICAASVLSYALWNLLIRYQRLSDLFLIKFTETLFAALFSAALLHEDILRLPYLISFLLICCGIALGRLDSSAFRRRKKAGR